MKRIFVTALTIAVSIVILTGCAVLQKPSENEESHADDSTFGDVVPYDAQLEIACVGGKLVFSRIATTPRVRASRPPFDETCITNYEDKHEIILVLFQIMDEKEAVEEHESLPTLQLLLYGQNDDEPWHYLFEIGTDGLVRVSNNGELICCIQISEEELQSIIQVLE